MANYFAAIHTLDDEALQTWSKTWIDVAVTAILPKYEVLLILGNQATRGPGGQFSQVSLPGVVLIDGIGHGTDTEFLGLGNAEVLYGDGIMPAGEVGKKIVHLLACSTARQLGAQFVGAGCAVFIGYNDLIPFGSKAVNQQIATADAQIELTLAAGGTVAKAIENAQGSFHQSGLDNIGLMLVSNPPFCQVTLASLIGVGSLPENTIATHQPPAPNAIASNGV